MAEWYNKRLAFRTASAIVDDGRDPAATIDDALAYVAKVEREAAESSLAAERARAERAEADLLTVAQTLGYSYEADGHASKPAPVDVLVGGVRELQQYADRATDQAARLARLKAVAEAAREFRRWDAILALTLGEGQDAEDAQDDLRAIDAALAALDGGEK